MADSLVFSAENGLISSVFRTEMRVDTATYVPPCVRSKGCACSPTNLAVTRTVPNVTVREIKSSPSAHRLNLDVRSCFVVFLAHVPMWLLVVVVVLAGLFCSIVSVQVSIPLSPGINCCGSRSRKVLLVLAVVVQQSYGLHGTQVWRPKGRQLLWYVWVTTFC